MLIINVPPSEFWDERNEVFIISHGQKLCLEHSLVSLSKWEARWKKPFLSAHDRSREEMIDYIRCMTVTQNVNPEIYYALTNKNLQDIENYIGDPMSATTFSKEHNKRRKNKEIITSELIYYWMVMYQIPFSCEKWHLNRLMTLINICSIKNEPPKKRSRNEILQQNYALNAQRRKLLNTRG